MISTWRIMYLTNWTEKWPGNAITAIFFSDHSHKYIHTRTHDTSITFICLLYRSLMVRVKKKREKDFYKYITWTKKCNKNCKEYWILHFSLSSRITRLTTFQKRLWNAGNEKFPAGRKIIIHCVQHARKWNFRFVMHISRRVRYRATYFRWWAIKLWV